MELHWTQLTPNLLAIATPLRGWLYRPMMDGTFQGSSTGPITSETLAQLLDTVLTAGQSAVSAKSAVGQQPSSRMMTPERWAYHTCDAYQSTWATERLMPRLADRFAALGRIALAQWARHKMKEERGHYTLALNDLRALGYDADKLVEQLVPRRGARLARYFEEQVDADDPIRAIGYAYVLERLALNNDERHIAQIEAALPPDVMATRCLRVHSRTGADTRHVAEMLTFIAGLSAAERHEIAIGVFETAQICADASEGRSLSQPELESRLRDFTRPVSSSQL